VCVQAFLQRFLRASHIATQVEYKCLEALTRYVLELSLLDVNMLAYRASTVAASTLLLCRILLAHMHSAAAAGGPLRPHVAWTRTLEHYTFHTPRELEGCVRKLHRTLLAASSRGLKMMSICHKYKQSKKGAVASLRFMTELPEHAFQRFAAFMVPADYFHHLNL
jgi:Cyclin, C-terminal domain